MTDLSRLRLALFTDTFAPQVNGVARTLARLRDAVEARGGIVQVFTPDDPTASPQTSVHRFPSRSFWAYPQLRLAWPGQRTVSSRLSAFRPTLVHAATEFGVGLAGRRWALEHDVPLVTSYHTNFTSYAAHYRLGYLAQPGWAFLRWFHNGARRTFCPTRAVAGELTARGFRDCAVWSRGVDSTRFHPTHRSSALRAQLGASDDTVVVAYIGRLASEKGVQTVLQSVGRAMSLRPGMLRCMIVGDGPAEETMRREAPAGTTFLGRLEGEALAQAYASADVFLFPSVTDTFGNVLVEAMASGLPVVAADVGPTREVIGTEGGWLVPAHDAEAFATQLVALIDRPLLRGDAGVAALKRAAGFSWDAVWAQLFADYAEVQQRRHRVPRTFTAQAAA